MLRKYYVCTNYGTACRRLTTKEKNERIKYVLQYSRTALSATIRIAFNSSIESNWNPTAPYKWNCKVAVEQLSLLQQLSQRQRDEGVAQELIRMKSIVSILSLDVVTLRKLI